MTEAPKSEGPTALRKIIELVDRENLEAVGEAKSKDAFYDDYFERERKRARVWLEAQTDKIDRAVLHLVREGGNRLTEEEIFKDFEWEQEWEEREKQHELKYGRNAHNGPRRDGFEDGRHQALKDFIQERYEGRFELRDESDRSSHYRSHIEIVRPEIKSTPYSTWFKT
ncbi:MAG: hypothetical protein AAB605_02580 [Patescibacteria group bacterium]